MTTLGKLAEVIGVELPESMNPHMKYGRVLTQHVYVQPGDVVISGKWYPEYTTVKEALERGAVAVFCNAKTKQHFPQDNVIIVEDPLDAVTKYQKWCAKIGTAKRIAITGSVGKTTTTGLINSVIANSFKTLTHHSAANSHGAILRNVQRLDPSHEYWVQKAVKQHPDMAKMNPSSVNTVRIMTLKANDNVYVLSSVVRIGKAGSKVDNFHSGGMSCGIKADGTLNDFATFVNGDRAKKHESGFVFAEGKIPNIERVCNEVKRLHYCLPMFGIISWDMCIDELGDPVLIEYNIGGGITVHQLSNGPLYGKHRQEILEAAFNQK